LAIILLILCSVPRLSFTLGIDATGTAASRASVPGAAVCAITFPQRRIIIHRCITCITCITCNAASLQRGMGECGSHRPCPVAESPLLMRRSGARIALSIQSHAAHILPCTAFEGSAFR
jgi:hypothetical protein